MHGYARFFRAHDHNSTSGSDTCAALPESRSSSTFRRSADSAGTQLVPVLRPQPTEWKPEAGIHDWLKLFNLF